MILKNNFLLSDAVQTLEFLVVATMTILCCPGDHRMSTFGCAQTTAFQKSQKIIVNLKYLINSTSFSFQTWSVSSFVFVFFDEKGMRKEMPLQELMILT